MRKGMSFGFTPSQFVLPIYSLRKGLIKELGGSIEKGERGSPQRQQNLL